MTDMQGICATTLPAGRGWRPSQFIPHEGGKITPLGDDVYLDKDYARETAAKLISQQKHREESRHDAIILSVGVAMFGVIGVIALGIMIAFQGISLLVLTSSVLMAMAMMIITLRLMSAHIMIKVRTCAEKTAEAMLSQPDPIADVFPKNLMESSLRDKLSKK